MIKVQGYNWPFKTTFTLPGTETSVEGDKVYMIMKASMTTADASAVINQSTSLTDSGNLSGTTVTAYLDVPKETTKLIATGNYVAEFYWEVAGTPTKLYRIGKVQQVTVEDTVKDVPTA